MLDVEALTGTSSIAATPVLVHERATATTYSVQSTLIVASRRAATRPLNAVSTITRRINRIEFETMSYRVDACELR